MSYWKDHDLWYGFLATGAFVPTLGVWGASALVLTMLAAGLVLSRTRKRISLRTIEPS